MRTRARDYIEHPATSRRKKRASAKDIYLQPNLIPQPNYLKSHPTTTDYPTPQTQINKSDISYLFDKLSLVNDGPTDHSLGRAIKPLPTPLATTLLQPSLISSFFNPNFKIKTLLPPRHTSPHQSPTTMQRSGSAAPHQVPPHQVEEWKTVKFKLGLPKLVCSGGDGIVKSDGSNYSDWEYRVTRLIETTCGRKGYLDNRQAHVSDPEGDEVMALIIELLVLVDIARKLAGSPSARHAFLKVRSMFFFPSRSAHLATWKDLLEIKFSDGSDLADYLKRVELRIEELDRAGFSWTKDSIKGIFYQLGLTPSFTNVSNVLNSRLRATPETPIGAKEVEEAVRSTNDDLSRDGSLVASFNSINFGDDPGAAGHTDMTFNVYEHQHQGCGMPGRGVYRPPAFRGSSVGGRGTIINRMAPPARTYTRDLRHCLACGKEGHWVRFCPHMREKDTTQSTRSIPSTSNPTASQSQYPTGRNFRFNLVDANGTQF